jgi:hypothetical protein
VHIAQKVKRKNFLEIFKKGLTFILLYAIIYM